MFVEFVINHVTFTSKLVRPFVGRRDRRVVGVDVKKINEKNDISYYNVL